MDSCGLLLLGNRPYVVTSCLHIGLRKNSGTIVTAPLIQPLMRLSVYPSPVAAWIQEVRLRWPNTDFEVPRNMSTAVITFFQNPTPKMVTLGKFGTMPSPVVSDYLHPKAVERKKARKRWFGFPDLLTFSIIIPLLDR